MSFPYRHLLLDEVQIGIRCEIRIIGEFDKELCFPACLSGDYYLTDHPDVYWKEHVITEKDLSYIKDAVCARFTEEMVLKTYRIKN